MSQGGHLKFDVWNVWAAANVVGLFQGWRNISCMLSPGLLDISDINVSWRNVLHAFMLMISPFGVWRFIAMSMSVVSCFR